MTKRKKTKQVKQYSLLYGKQAIVSRSSIFYNFRLIRLLFFRCYFFPSSVPPTATTTTTITQKFLRKFSILMVIAHENVCMSPVWLFMHVFVISIHLASRGFFLINSASKSNFQSVQNDRSECVTQMANK